MGQEAYKKDDEYKLTSTDEKNQQNRLQYFKKNRTKILEKIHEKKHECHQYDIVPILDFYELSSKMNIWKISNDYVDKKRFEENIVFSLNLFYLESKKNLVARIASLPIVIKSDHKLFFTFFTGLYMFIFDEDSRLDRR